MTRMDELTSGQATVLKGLRKAYGTISDNQLALQTGLPRASCRRTVQELRALGYNITYQTGRSGGYTLHQEA